MIALLLGGIAIGASPIFVRLSEVGPMSTAFWRVALALLPLLTWDRTTAGARLGEAPLKPIDYCALVLPGLFLSADLAAWHLSIHMTSIANATLLANLAPIFVTLGAWVLFSSPVTGLFLAGLATSLVGVAVLTLGSGPLGGGHLAGDATAAVAAVFYAGYILVVGRLRSRFSTQRIMVWSTASAAVCMFPVAFFLEGNIFPVTIFGWTMVAGLALIAHVGGQGLIAYALAFLKPAFSSLTLLLQPVVAAVLAWSLLNEPVGFMQALGGAIVIGGILIARRG